MTENIIDLAAARQRRGLAAPRVPVRPPRPTLIEAIRQYDAKTFETAGTINLSDVAHDVQTRHDEGLTHLGYARCGAHGIVGQPNLTALVCLRCWPWWKA